MNAISKKLKSRAGASITFALMIFLVCAVVSGIVIVAASTSSGRLAGLKEMDGRYYIVTSAAEKLCDIFDFDESRKVIVTKATDGSYEAKNVDGTSVEPLLKIASEKLISKEALNPVDSFNNRTITLEGKSYTCDISERLEGSQIIFDISAGTTANKTYRLSVTFASNVKQEARDDSEGTEQYSVTWKLRDIRKNRAAPAASGSNP
ncbi:MAG: hypothetical protein IJ124_09410 [Clostridia bacterium]|nr:hypothetical protein [Clostridia bacterium]MBQ8962783.1 hypothetical protein [Clostridia bacterium]